LYVETASLPDSWRVSATVCILLKDAGINRRRCGGGDGKTTMLRCKKRYTLAVLRIPLRAFVARGASFLAFPAPAFPKPQVYAESIGTR